jgi:hypothetical protein
MDDFQSKYSGEQIEEILDNVKNGGGDYVLPIATTEELGGIKSYSIAGEVNSDPTGIQYGVNVTEIGLAHVKIPYGDNPNAGVVYVDSELKNSTNPISNKAVKNALDEYATKDYVTSVLKQSIYITLNTEV